MNINDISHLLEANFSTPPFHTDVEIRHVFASDLMSDVLTIDAGDMILLSGLSNIQTIRTAEMSDINFVVLVRNKKATPEMVEIAKKVNIVILESSYSMFKACGLLYQKGLEPVY